MASVLERNNVQVSGRGEQALVFAHGFGCDQNMWRFVVPAFENEYKIVLFDYVGAGKSDQAAYSSERYSTLEGYAQDLREVCAALDLHRPIFIGHSVSCMVGVLAWELFQKLVLVGPSPCYINDPPYVGGFEEVDLHSLLDMMQRNVGWAAYLAGTVMKNPDRPELSAELEQSFCATPPRVAQEFARVTFFSDNRADLARVKVPCLILQCSEDAIAPLAVGEYCHRQLPDSKLVVMRATGHCPHMSHPEETIEKIRDFLRG